MMLASNAGHTIDLSNDAELPFVWTDIVGAVTGPMSARHRLPIYGQRDEDLAALDARDDSAFFERFVRHQEPEDDASWIRAYGDLTSFVDGETDETELSINDVAAILAAPQGALPWPKRQTAEFFDAVSAFVESRVEMCRSIARDAAKRRARWGHGNPFPELAQVPSGPCVYFVQTSGFEGEIKIGRSKNLRDRMYEIQTCHPKPIVVLAVLLGGHKEERELHRRFQTHRTYGEWFAPHEDILTFIRERRQERDGLYFKPEASPREPVACDHSHREVKK